MTLSYRIGNGDMESYINPDYPTSQFYVEAGDYSAPGNMISLGDGRSLLVYSSTLLDPDSYFGAAGQIWCRFVEADFTLGPALLVLDYTGAGFAGWSGQDITVAYDGFDTVAICDWLSFRETGGPYVGSRQVALVDVTSGDTPELVDVNQAGDFGWSPIVTAVADGTFVVGWRLDSNQYLLRTIQRSGAVLLTGPTVSLGVNTRAYALAGQAAQDGSGVVAYNDAANQNRTQLFSVDLATRVITLVGASNPITLFFTDTNIAAHNQHGEHANSILFLRNSGVYNEVWYDGTWHEQSVALPHVIVGTNPLAFAYVAGPRVTSFIRDGKVGVFYGVFGDTGTDFYIVDDIFGAAVETPMDLFAAAGAGDYLDRNLAEESTQAAISISAGQTHMMMTCFYSEKFLGGGDWYGGIPEYDGSLPGGRYALFAIDTVIPPDPVDGSAADLSTTVNAGCVLGCEDTRVILLDRCGTRTVADITGQLNAANYSRLLDDTSDAQASVTTTGDNSSNKCNVALGQIRTWRNSLAMYRGEDLVWYGPITNILLQKESVVISARDISAWLDVRVIHNDYDFFDELATDVAKILIEDALGIDDPCGFVPNIVVTGTSTKRIDKSVTAHEGYAGEVIRDMAKSIIDFTVLGTTIIISDKLEFGPFARLTDEDFQIELEIEERGLDAATKWYINGAGVEGQAGGEDPYFGLLERVYTDDDMLDEETVNTAAATRLAVTNPPPLYINIPDGARLSPEAPICFEQLVPGTLIDVMLRGYPREVASRNSLTAVKVEISADDEAVGITLSPPGDL